MDLIQTIRERRSIRAFKPDPVPKQTIEEILRLTICAPSAINLQPWEFTVVTGDEKERLLRKLNKAYLEKQVSCSPRTVKPLPKRYGKRGARTFDAMRPFIEEMGADFNRFVNEGSCNFYRAPVAVMICLDRSFSETHLLDIGAALGYLVLAAWNFGLGTCPIGLITAYGEEVKELLNLPESNRVVLGVALGYPDWESPINRFKSPREDIEDSVRWIE